MSQGAIVQKLRAHIDRGISTEADVVYLLVESAKYLEREHEDRHGVLRFYRNWAVHSYIADARRAGAHVPVRLDAAVERFLRDGDTDTVRREVQEVLSLERLRDDVRMFSGEAGLPARLTEDKEDWGAFVRLLLDVLADIPLVFRDAPAIRTFTLLEGGRIREEDGALCRSWTIESRENGREIEGELQIR